MNFLEQSVEWYAGLQNHIMKSPHLAPLQSLFPFSPDDLKDYRKTREIHFNTQMQAFGNTPLRDMMIQAIDEYVKQDLKVASFIKQADPKTAERLHSINTKGYTHLSSLSADKVKAMREHFEKFPVVSNDQRVLTFEEASKTENIANYQMATILKCPHLLEMASDPEILSLVESYLGTIPTVIVMATWWSFAGRNNAKDAQLFHYDYDDYRFCKLFLYLTDVDMDSGPHCFVEGTHRADEVYNAKMKWIAEKDRFNDFYARSLRKSDEDVRKYFGKEFTYLTGNAGSRFIVDTIGIHKGMLPTKHNRLLCQITFGVSPSLQEAPTVLELNRNSVGYFDVAQQPSSRYVHRFFINVKDDAQASMAPAASATKSETTHLNSVDEWSDETLKFFLESIFKDAVVRDTVDRYFKNQNIQIRNFVEFLTNLRMVFKNQIAWSNLDPNYPLVKGLADLADYEQAITNSLTAYNPKLKPNPTAVYWPNPHREPATSVYETLPIAKKYPIVSKDTPIGSAGSCFAFEIAYYLQEQGFNYIVTEKGHRPDEGVLIDAFDPANPYEKFSANYGILFNTPSFRQLAEKAFGKRKLPRICNKVPHPQRAGEFLYCDPFRENVFFGSPEDYERDYEKHIEATRLALLKSKVFILTLGLNECWEFMKDGSVVSRNPHSDIFYRLLRHKTMTVDENISNVQAFVDIVREFNPDFQVILSVSPIPFLATGRAADQHVITANAHSKAVLRVAAEEIVRKNKGVYYLPSYEMVTNCIQNPWESDQRHVTRAAVHRVMDLFKTTFVW